MNFSQIVLLLQVVLMGFGNSAPLFNQTCPTKCGNVSIPFPFGTEEGCYLDKSYYIQCNSVTQIPSLFNARYAMLIPPFHHPQVLEIKLDGKLRVTLPTAYILYDSMGKTLGGSTTIVESSRFPISSTQNMLTGVGCEIEARLTGEFTTGLTAQGAIMNCYSTCSSLRDVKNRTCLGGFGCCHVALPESMAYVFITATKFYVDDPDYHKYGYAFIVEKDAFNASTGGLSTMSYNTSFPVVLDWSVGDNTCEEAQKGNGTYMCKENSVCYNGEGGLSGYRCACSDGYSGNPYIKNGCQDVDECGEQNDCLPGHCENTSGSYKCVCPQGYQGNAQKGGECTPVVRKHKSEGRSAIEGISEGIVGAALVMIFVYWGAKKRLRIKGRKDFFKQNGGIMLQKMLSMCNDPVNNAKIFTEEELKKATDNFNDANVIGQGGYGTVYKGTLANKTMVAIKKSKTIDQSQINQFFNEVIILSQINHPNIVKLLGCCLETQVPFIVYEYITNNTLCHHIHTQAHATLTFGKRLKIAVETAEALAYMHSTTQIIHRDVKPSNILLDDEFTAKVSDFGISRLIPVGETHLSTAVVGTIGYVDPEYFRTSKLTEKSDVYSFGVVLMELLTGKTIHSLETPLTAHKGAATYLNSLLERDAFLLVVDDRIKKDEYAEVVKCVAKIATDCLHFQGTTRPTMEEVKQELEQLKSVLSSIEAGSI